jgi:acetyl esterase/lipase
MLISLADAAYAVRCLPHVQYGTAPAATRDWQITLTLDLLLPDPLPAHPVPVVAYLHGGGWECGDKAAGMYPWHSPLMAAHGFAAVNIGYRLSWMAPHPAQIDDIKSAITWLRANADAYGLDPNLIGVWGDSAGGHLAAMLGVDQPGTVQAVVARSAPTDNTPTDAYDIDTDDVCARLVGGRPSEHVDTLRELSPILHVHDKVPPFLVVHGTDDEIVSIDQAEAFVQALRDQGADVTFDAINGGKHDLASPERPDPWDDLGRQAVAFFREHLRS